jgi:hypothetical protein
MGGAAGGAGGVAVAIRAPSVRVDCNAAMEINAATRLFRSGLGSVKESGSICAVIDMFVRNTHV